MSAILQTPLRILVLLASLFPVQPASAQSPDLPTAGRSLFDHLTTDSDGLRRVPFPFTALMERVRREVGPDMLGHAGVRSVLIPLGRSLQRNASVSEAYRYPRVVAAVVGEPKPGAPLLKDRLYFGYHEKAGLLEVISYNEAAGRFEFQVVKDYRAGGEARVFHARRIVCLSCHHDAAPIFSRPGWDETNANLRVAAQLRRVSSQFHGVPAARSIDEPNAIDNAVARASRLDLTQRIWRDGCAQSDAIECRVQATLAAIKYRLGADTVVDATTAAYRDRLLAPLRRAGEKRWPAGLPIVDPNVPNRDPLAIFPVDRIDFRDNAALLRSAEVRPAFDPLQPRAPLGRWRAADEADVALYARGVAEFLAPSDIHAIDRRLQQLRTGASRRTVRATCRADRSTRTDALRCAVAESGSRSLQFEIRLARGEGGYTSGDISAISVSGSTLAQALDLAPAVGRPGQAPRTWSYDGPPVRLPDATAVERVLLHWRGDMQPAAEVDLHLADDTPVLEQAVGEIARQTRLGESDTFGDAPLRRGALMRALFTQLGIATPPSCCDGPLPGVQPVLDIDAAGSTGDLPAPLRTFVRHCATCHDTREESPPGFLRGGADEVSRNLARCAERIAYRLAMWEQAPEARSRIPMPPPLANGTAVPPPPRDDLAQMRAYIAPLAGVNVRLDLPYEALAACRPESH